MPLFRRKSSTVWLLLVLILAVVFATVQPINGILTFAKDWALYQQVDGFLNGKQRADFALQDGDRVVFFGDSITESRLYTTYIEHYVVTHYPERNVTFLNTGWSGDQVTGALARLKHDVINYKPTVVTLLFGMNDGQYKDFDSTILKVYEDGLTAIIDELKAKTTARIYVMTPTAYDQADSPSRGKTNRYNDTLEHYAEAAEQIALREGLPVIDLHSVTTEALHQAQAADPAYTFIPDRIHPDENGHLIMAIEILRFWGAPAQGKEIMRKISIGKDKTLNLSVSAPLTWPFPFPAEKIRNIRPEVMEMGKVNLKITDLLSGQYLIKVDGADAGEYPAQGLSSGIPLTSLSIQSIESSHSVVNLIRQRVDIFFMGWRTIQLPFSGEYKSAVDVISAFNSLEDEMTQRIRKLGRSHEYHISLTLKE